MLTLAFSLAMLIVIRLMARFPLMFYRNNYGPAEKKAAWIIGAGCSSWALIMKGTHSVASGTNSDIVAAILIVVSVCVTIYLSWYILHAANLNG